MPRQKEGRDCGDFGRWAEANATPGERTRQSPTTAPTKQLCGTEPPRHSHRLRLENKAGLRPRSYRRPSRRAVRLARSAGFALRRGLEPDRFEAIQTLKSFRGMLAWVQAFLAATVR